MKESNGLDLSLRSSWLQSLLYHIGEYGGTSSHDSLLQLSTGHNLEVSYSDYDTTVTRSCDKASMGSGVHSDCQVVSSADCDDGSRAVVELECPIQSTIRREAEKRKSEGLSSLVQGQKHCRIHRRPYDKKAKFVVGSTDDHSHDVQLTHQERILEAESLCTILPVEPRTTPNVLQWMSNKVTALESTASRVNIKHDSVFTETPGCTACETDVKNDAQASLMACQSSSVRASDIREQGRHCDTPVISRGSYFGEKAIREKSLLRDGNAHKKLSYNRLSHARKDLLQALEATSDEYSEQDICRSTQSVP